MHLYYKQNKLHVLQEHKNQEGTEGKFVSRHWVIKKLNVLVKRLVLQLQYYDSNM